MTAAGAVTICRSDPTVKVRVPIAALVGELGKRLGADRGPR